MLEKDRVGRGHGFVVCCHGHHVCAAERRVAVDTPRVDDERPAKGDSDGKQLQLPLLAAEHGGAAGSLPVAALLGFNPSEGLYSATALIFVYIAVPVVIKIIAALLIWYIRIEADRGSVRDEIMGGRPATLR